MPPIRFASLGSQVRQPFLSALPSAVGALRIASVPATRSRKDSHLLTTGHVGVPKTKPPAAGRGLLPFTSEQLLELDHEPVR